MKLNQDRLWLLKQFNRDGGWSIGRPGLEGIKKWENHRSALVKSGLLEGDEYGMYRITDAGRRALAEQEGTGE